MDTLTRSQILKEARDSGWHNVVVEEPESGLKGYPLTKQGFFKIPYSSGSFSQSLPMLADILQGSSVRIESSADLTSEVEAGSCFDPARRAILRAELDAWYANLYGLTKDELRYILDPTTVAGTDYPSETFRVLKDRELRVYGEYRTERLVLEAWERWVEVKDSV